MKTQSIARLTAVLLLCILDHQRSTVHAQGSLTPPGAPGPTMLTLSQIEPLIPISSAPYFILKPGAYYLTTNLTGNGSDAIDIDTNGVTLDLNGFTISSTAVTGGAGVGFQANALSDITICNGHIAGGFTNNAGVYAGNGFTYGIAYFTATPPANIRVIGVSISGCRDYGIYLNVGTSSLVESCTVHTASIYGIYASTIKDSTAMDCGSIAIDGDTVFNCHGQGSGSGFGISATIAQNCYGSSTGSGGGISVSGVATGCYGSSVSGIGITAHIANSCMVGAGTTNITYKYNMP